MTDPNPATGAPRSAPVILGVLTLLALSAAWLDLRARAAAAATALEAHSERLQALERAVHLFRMERGSEGLGAKALTEQLHFWAPMMSSALTPEREMPRVREHVADVLAALKALGGEAMPALRQAFDDADSTGEDDDVRRVLIDAMAAVDPRSTTDLLEQCVRGWELEVSPRIRVYAGSVLCRLDGARATRVLREVLSYDSARGVQPERMLPDQRQRYLAIGRTPQRSPMFFNFVDQLVEASGPAAEDALLMAAGRPEHDLATLQQCVKHLGEMRSRNALASIKRLFEAPPEMLVNPIFQGHCLDAIARIAGAEACDYFKQRLVDQQHPQVIERLKELIKQSCQ